MPRAGSEPLRWDDREGDCEPFLGGGLTGMHVLSERCLPSDWLRMLYFFIMVLPDGAPITPCDLISLSPWTSEMGM